MSEEPATLPGREHWSSEDDGRLLYALMHNGREWGGPGASTDRGTLAYYRHVAGLFLARRKDLDDVVVKIAEKAVIDAARALCDDWDANRATSGRALRDAVAAAYSDSLHAELS